MLESGLVSADIRGVEQSCRGWGEVSRSGR
jgi:hypothetical protein